MSMKTPKDFRIFPSSSVLQKCEAETVAANIMVILYRTGNTFREITWEENSSAAGLNTSLLVISDLHSL